MPPLPVLIACGLGLFACLWIARRAGRDAHPPPVTDPAVPPAPPVPTPLPRPQWLVDLLRLHNEVRKLERQPPLTLDERLTRAAQQHSFWMASRGDIDHVGCRGLGPDGRVLIAGCDVQLVGENLLLGVDSPAAAVAAWYRSTPHREVMADPKFTAVGFGVTRDAEGHYWWCALYTMPWRDGERPTGAATLMSLSGPLVR